MASKSCRACLFTLRTQSRNILKTEQISSPFIKTRTFMTTPHFYAELPESNAQLPTSIPPVTLKVGDKASRKASLGAKAFDQLARVTGELAGETYSAYGVTENLVKECSRKADYSVPQAGDSEAEIPKTTDGEDLGVGNGWWHSEAGLKPTFSTWSQVTMLHMYLLSVRFRCFDSQHTQIWQQHLLDHFFFDAETKMSVNHNMHARGTRNKYLKDLFVQWRGLLAAYDEGIVKGDAVLAAAVWRNIFKADENVDITKLAAIVSYMRSVLKGLDAVDDLTVMNGKIAFGKPEVETDLVRLRSQMMDLPFKDH